MNSLPVVGTGVTEVLFSDRIPYTVIEVSTNGKRLIIQEDTYTLTSGDIYVNAQKYEYRQNPAGRKIIISLRKDGRWRAVGAGRGATTYAVGQRGRYYDPSF